MTPSATARGDPPGTRTEVAGLADTVEGAEVVTGSAVSEAAIKRRSGARKLANYRMLQVATRGLRSCTTAGASDERLFAHIHPAPLAFSVTSASSRAVGWPVTPAAVWPCTSTPSKLWLMQVRLKVIT